MTAYYNEIDPYAAQWLRNLITAGHIAPGDVDERSIEDVRPDDLRGYTQCHFFAGIGVWSYALRNAGWADDRPVWTGSCPCQPFSAAGKRKGTADERHLWPVFAGLIAECRPDTVFGEQVDAAIRDGWLDLVQTDLEQEGYTVGAVVLPAAGFGAPHLRHRLYWVADARSAGLEGCDEGSMGRQRPPVERSICVGRVDHPTSARHDGSVSSAKSETWDEARVRLLGAGCGVGGVADSDHEVQSGRGIQRSKQSNEAGAGDTCERSEGLRATCDPGPTNGFWRDADWLGCRDDKWRPVKPGTFPLAHGAPARVGRLRAYGNAIVAPVAQAFIEAYMCTLELRAADNNTLISNARLVPRAGIAW